MRQIDLDLRHDTTNNRAQTSRFELIDVTTIDTMILQLIYLIERLLFFTILVLRSLSVMFFILLFLCLHFCSETSYLINSECFEN